ncbi:DUF2492 family protein [Grimontia sedimenti]|uniref:DUF2492 family protein n=1 Tax=Grimontia sedimenti TaxID=2711294 RepID=UPI001F16B83D|nr:DUF2492 family protein [Grimontia sedimenti]
MTHWVDGQWGASARFHTCSQQGLSFSEVLEFLRRRKKSLKTWVRFRSTKRGSVITDMW